MAQGESDFSGDPGLFVDLGSLSRILALYELYSQVAAPFSAEVRDF